MSLLRRILPLLLLVQVAACDASESPASPDAGPCESDRPGMYVRFEGAHLPYSFGAQLDVVIGAAHERYDGDLRIHYPDAGPPFVALPYPATATAGPASIDYYYPGPGIINTVGHADFQADPGTCVTIPMTLVESNVPDAGPAR